MGLPAKLQALVNRERLKIETGQTDDLPPSRRFMIYNFIGRTAVPAEFFERVRLREEGILTCSHADRVRARLAVLTAQRVAPIHHSGITEEVKSWTTLEQKTSYLEAIRYSQPWEIAPHSIPDELVFDHLLLLAQGNLKPLSDVAESFTHVCEFHNYGGGLPTDRETCAHWAAIEALNEALGMRNFQILQNGEGGRFCAPKGRVWWEKSAANHAHEAYSCVLDTDGRIVELEAARSREFWLWWLEEALPMAWEMEQDYQEPDIETAPYWQSVFSLKKP